MGALTEPAPPRDPLALGAIAAETAVTQAALLDAMAAAPELAAHVRTLRRFDAALAAWRRSVADASPMAQRYQTALLQQAAQVVTSGLHVEALSTSESARVQMTRRDVGSRTSAPPPWSARRSLMLPLAMSDRHEQRSLFGEILDWMLAPLLLLWPMSVALTWLVAQGIANRPYDRELGQLAHSVAREMRADPGFDRGLAGRHDLRLDEPTAALLRSDDVDRIWFQVRNAQGELAGGDGELAAPSDERAPADEVQFRDDTVHNDAVRVAYLWVGTPAGANSGVVVQVAETLDKRSRLATEIIKGVILPQFVILPLAVLLVWFALARGIAPLNTLQQRIRRRQSQDLSPIDEHDVPEEVAPLVRSINDLLARLDQTMGSQKHFLADAAHQMKTPLAGLRMQAELAQREIDAGGDPQSIKRSLKQIARSSQSAAHMVNQLLSMARAEDAEQARRLQDVPIIKLAREVVRDFVPRAMDKRIDLGYEGPDADPAAPRIVGQPLLVRELIRNLIDNALQYTPAGGTVTVRLRPDPYGQVMVLQVEDTGPGIPEAEREQVFQPFYRALGTDVDGSGLGLAIVKEIADKHEATVTIAAARTIAPGGEETPGALFVVRFPCKPAP